MTTRSQVDILVVTYGADAFYHTLRTNSILYLLQEPTHPRWQTLPLTFSLALSRPGRHTTLKPRKVFFFFSLHEEGLMKYAGSS